MFATGNRRSSLTNEPLVNIQLTPCRQLKKLCDAHRSSSTFVGTRKRMCFASAEPLQTRVSARCSTAGKALPERSFRSTIYVTLIGKPPKAKRYVRMQKSLDGLCHWPVVSRTSARKLNSIRPTPPRLPRLWREYVHQTPSTLKQAMLSALP
jgi:hypothetical protein